MQESNYDTDLVKQIADDPSLSPFLSEDFGSIGYVSAQVKVGTVQACLEKLTRGVDLLDHEIHVQVVDKHDELFKQVGTVRELRGALASVSVGVSKLQAAVKRLQGQLNEPYEKYCGQLQQLERLQDACDTLRRVHRVLTLTAKLRALMPDQHSVENDGIIRNIDAVSIKRIDLAPAAKILSELDVVIGHGEGSVGSIDVVDAEKGFIAQALREVSGSASDIMQKGMESQSLSDIATAVQAFFNLGDLSDRVKAVLASQLKTVKISTRSTLDVTSIRQESAPATATASHAHHGPGGVQRTGAPRAGQTDQWNTTLFNRLTKLFQVVHDSIFKIWLLQRVLVSKQDPETRIHFVDALLDKMADSNLAKTFWKSVLVAISDEIVYAMTTYPYIEQALVTDYARVLRLANDMIMRLNSVTNLRGIAGITEVPTELWSSLRQMLANRLESPYLARCLNKLQQPFLRSFNQNIIPSVQETKSIASLARREFGIAKDDEILSVGVCRVVSQACSLFAAKAEEAVVVDSDSHASGAPTSSHQFNAELCNSLILLYNEVNTVAESLTGDKFEILKSSLDTVMKLVDQIVSPLFSTFERHLERAVSRIHDQLLGVESRSGDLSGAGEILGIPQGEVDDCSVYMAALVGEINRLRKQHISMFLQCEAIQDRIVHLASYVVLVFVFHSSLVRPLGSEGRAMLARDTAVLESAVSALWGNKADKTLVAMIRAVRTLLFIDGAQICESVKVQLAGLPVSMILNHLFSRGPVDLKSVHTLRDWTCSQYVRWMMGRSEEERLKVIASALDAYALQVDRRGETHYAPIYAIMRSLLGT